MAKLVWPYPGGCEHTWDPRFWTLNPEPDV